MFDSKTVKPANIVRVDIADDDALYAAYMAFITNGGIFVQAHQLGAVSYTLGMDIYLLLHLKAENERWPVHGRVVWVSTLEDRQHATGCGVQFRDQGETRQHLETLLNGRLQSDQPTLTL